MTTIEKSICTSQMEIRSKLASILLNEVTDKHMVVLNDAAEKLGVAQHFVDEACYDIQSEGLVIHYGISKHDGKGYLNVLATPDCPRDHALAHLDEIKDLDSHRLA